MSDDRMSVHSGLSAVSEMTITHRSLFHGKENEDKYTTEQRLDILASLWDTHAPGDLHPPNDFDVQKKIRTLALRDEEQAINQVKRFDTVFRQALLYTQHEIIIIEEALSTGIHIPSHVLRKVLMEYTSLVKSFKGLRGMKQPGQPDCRVFGRVLATELHEPKYWYAVDALDLIDLQVEETWESHDSVREFLQKKIPVSFLDQVGKERRELDDIMAKKELLSGGMAQIIKAYHRHGRYISPSVDNFARILFALFGGIFLLVHMIAMAYINATRYLLIATALFVPFFAFVLALSSKASNQELVAATAAYAADGIHWWFFTVHYLSLCGGCVGGTEDPEYIFLQCKHKPVGWRFRTDDPFIVNFMQVGEMLPVNSTVPMDTFSTAPAPGTLVVGTAFLVFGVAFLAAEAFAGWLEYERLARGSVLLLTVWQATCVRKKCRKRPLEQQDAHTEI